MVAWQGTRPPNYPRGDQYDVVREWGQKQHLSSQKPNLYHYDPFGTSDNDQYHIGTSFTYNGIKRGQQFYDRHVGHDTGSNRERSIYEIQHYGGVALDRQGLKAGEDVLGSVTLAVFSHLNPTRDSISSQFTAVRHDRDLLLTASRVAKNSRSRHADAYRNKLGEQGRTLYERLCSETDEAVEKYAGKVLTVDPVTSSIAKAWREESGRFWSVKALAALLRENAVGMYLR